jgi:hypothetical protein
MSAIPKVPEEVFEELTGQLQRTFGDGVLSILLIGSGARGEYLPKISDLNFVVVLRDCSPSVVARFQQEIIRWRKRRVATPLFVTEQYIRSSLDSFPIEFLDMKRAHTLVWGKDLLADIQISMKNLRLQCERELKGKLLHLRQSFLELRGSSKELAFLIKRSLTALAPVFRACLVVRGFDHPQRHKDLVREMVRRFALEEALFEELIHIAEGKKTVSESRIDRLFDRYVGEIEKVAKEIDQLATGDKEEL